MTRIIATILAVIFSWVNIVWPAIPKPDERVRQNQEQTIWADRQAAVQRLSQNNRQLALNFLSLTPNSQRNWIPASAGMTTKGKYVSDSGTSLLPTYPDFSVPANIKDLITSILPYANIEDFFTLTPALSHREREVRRGFSPQGRGIRGISEKDKQLVVIIQDIHSHVEAQRNIANIITEVVRVQSSEFRKQNKDVILTPEGPPIKTLGDRLNRGEESRSSSNLKTGDSSALPQNDNELAPSPQPLAPVVIGIEGATGPSDAELYRSFPDKEINQAIAEFMLEATLIGGAEYAAMVAESPVTLLGVEDEKLYQANIDAFRNSEKESQQVIHNLTSLQAENERKKESVFSSELVELDRKVKGFEDGKLRLGEYVRYLKEVTAPDESGNYKRRIEANFKNIHLFLDALALEESLDINQAEIERQSLISKLADTLSKDELSRLLEVSVSFKLGKVAHASYYDYLDKMCVKHAIHISEYASLKKYIEYCNLAENIDKRGLFDEIERLKETLVERLIVACPDPKTARQIVETSRFLALTENLITHNLTDNEWKQYKEFRVQNLDTFEKFYEVATSRNKVLVENLLSKVRSQNNNAKVVAGFSLRTSARLNERNDAMNSMNAVAVLVAGGFHTSGITKILKDKNISYLVLSPKLTKIDANSHYLDAFNKKDTPLAKLMLGERIFLQSPRGMFSKVFHGYEYVPAMAKKSWETLQILLMAVRHPQYKAKDITAELQPYTKQLDNETVDIGEPVHGANRLTAMKVKIGSSARFIAVVYDANKAVVAQAMRLYTKLTAGGKLKAFTGTLNLTNNVTGAEQTLTVELHQSKSAVDTEQYAYIASRTAKKFALHIFVIWLSAALLATLIWPEAYRILIPDSFTLRSIIKFSLIYNVALTPLLLYGQSLILKKLEFDITTFYTGRLTKAAFYDRTERKVGLHPYVEKLRTDKDEKLRAFGLLLLLAGHESQHWLNHTLSRMVYSLLARIFPGLTSLNGNNSKKYKIILKVIMWLDDLHSYGSGVFYPLMFVAAIAWPHLVTTTFASQQEKILERLSTAKDYMENRFIELEDKGELTSTNIARTQIKTIDLALDAGTYKYSWDPGDSEDTNEPRKRKLTYEYSSEGLVKSTYERGHKEGPREPKEGDEKHYFFAILEAFKAAPDKKVFINQLRTEEKYYESIGQRGFHWIFKYAVTKFSDGDINVMLFRKTLGNKSEANKIILEKLRLSPEQLDTLTEARLTEALNAVLGMQDFSFRIKSEIDAGNLELPSEIRLLLLEAEDKALSGEEMETQKLLKLNKALLQAIYVKETLKSRKRESDDPIGINGLYISDRNKLPEGYSPANLSTDEKEYGKGMVNEMLFWYVEPKTKNENGEFYMITNWAKNKERGSFKYLMDGYIPNAMNALREIESKANIGLKNIEKLAVDPLTQIFGRRHIKETLETQIKKIKRERTINPGEKPTSLLFLDIDHFKSVNDTYGHDVGDIVLKTIAKAIKEQFRESDPVGRWGGEEFIVILPEANARDAVEKANALREKVKEISFVTQDGKIIVAEEGQPLKKTISIGVAEWKEDMTADQLIKNADSALYYSKNNGRDRVTLFTESGFLQPYAVNPALSSTQKESSASQGLPVLTLFGILPALVAAMWYGSGLTALVNHNIGIEAAIAVGFVWAMHELWHYFTGVISWIWENKMRKRPLSGQIQPLPRFHFGLHATSVETTTKNPWLKLIESLAALTALPLIMYASYFLPATLNPSFVPALQAAAIAMNAHAILPLQHIQRWFGKNLVKQPTDMDNIIDALPTNNYAAQMTEKILVTGAYEDLAPHRKIFKLSPKLSMALAAVMAAFIMFMSGVPLSFVWGTFGLLTTYPQGEPEPQIPDDIQKAIEKVAIEKSEEVIGNLKALMHGNGQLFDDESVLRQLIMPVIRRIFEIYPAGGYHQDNAVMLTGNIMRQLNFLLQRYPKLRSKELFRLVIEPIIRSTNPNSLSETLQALRGQSRKLLNIFNDEPLLKEVIAPLLRDGGTDAGKDAAIVIDLNELLRIHPNLSTPKILRGVVVPLVQTFGPDYREVFAFLGKQTRLVNEIAQAGTTISATDRIVLAALQAFSQNPEEYYELLWILRNNELLSRTAFERVIEIAGIRNGFMNWEKDGLRITSYGIRQSSSKKGIAPYLLTRSDLKFKFNFPHVSLAFTDKEMTFNGYPGVIKEWAESEKADRRKWYSIGRSGNELFYLLPHDEVISIVKTNGEEPDNPVQVIRNRIEWANLIENRVVAKKLMDDVQQPLPLNSVTFNIEDDDILSEYNTPRKHLEVSNATNLFELFQALEVEFSATQDTASHLLYAFAAGLLELGVNNQVWSVAEHWKQPLPNNAQIRIRRLTSQISSSSNSTNTKTRFGVKIAFTGVLGLLVLYPLSLALGFDGGAIPESVYHWYSSNLVSHTSWLWLFIAPLILGVTDFLWRYDIKVDEKGRFPLPPKYRERIPENVLILRPDFKQGIIRAYTKPFWQEKLKNESPQNTHERDEYMLKMNSSVLDVELDPEGRILIPKDLREQFQFESKVKIAGAGEHFEMWPVDKFNEKYGDQLGKTYITSMLALLVGLGIALTLLTQAPWGASALAQLLVTYTAFSLVIVAIMASNSGLQENHEMNAVAEADSILAARSHGNNEPLIENGVRVLTGLLTLAQTSASRYDVENAFHLITNLGKAIIRDGSPKLARQMLDALMSAEYHSAATSPLSFGAWSELLFKSYLEIIIENPSQSGKLAAYLASYYWLSQLVIPEHSGIVNQIIRLVNRVSTPKGYRIVRPLVLLFLRDFPGQTGLSYVEGGDSLRPLCRACVYGGEYGPGLGGHVRMIAHHYPSARLVNLVEAQLEFYRTRNVEILRPLVTDDVFSKLANDERIDKYNYVFPLLWDELKVEAKTKNIELNAVKDIASFLTLERLDEITKMLHEKHPRDAIMLTYLRHHIRIYMLLNERYNPSSIEAWEERAKTLQDYKISRQVLSLLNALKASDYTQALELDIALRETIQTRLIKRKVDRENAASFSKFKEYFISAIKTHSDAWVAVPESTQKEFREKIEITFPQGFDEIDQAKVEHLFTQLNKTFIDAYGILQVFNLLEAAVPLSGETAGRIRAAIAGKIASQELDLAGKSVGVEGDTVKALQYSDQRLELYKLDDLLRRIEEVLVGNFADNISLEPLTSHNITEAANFMANLARGLRATERGSQTLVEYAQMLGEPWITPGLVRDRANFMQQQINEVEYDRVSQEYLRIAISVADHLAVSGNLKLYSKVHDVRAHFINDLLARESIFTNLRDFLNRLYKSADSEVKIMEPPRLFHFDPVFGSEQLKQLDAIPKRLAARDVLAGKGLGLLEMSAMGLPVPPGFILPIRLNEKYLPETIKEGITTLEKNLSSNYDENLRFGDTENPLIVAVRGAAPFSMPGQLVTIANVGISETAVRNGLAKRLGEKTAWQAYIQFMEEFGSSVYGIPIELFDKARNDVLNIAGKSSMNALTRYALEEIAKRYQSIVSYYTGKDASKAFFEDDLWEQLREAIRATYRSWWDEHAPARHYRQAKGISEDWPGTVAIIQQMVFGTLPDGRSGAGIAISSDIELGVAEPYGSFELGIPGRILTAGTSQPKPLSHLEGIIPEVYEQLRKHLKELEQNEGYPQEVEFIVESGKLFIVQTRNARFGRAGAPEFAQPIPKTAEGLGASGGAYRGLVVFSEELLTPAGVVDKDRVAILKKEAKDRNVDGLILVKNAVTPEDIYLILEGGIEGFIAYEGSPYSHAGDMARTNGWHAILGVRELTFLEDPALTTIAGHRLIDDKGNRAILSIDGQSGAIAIGRYPLAGEPVEEQTNPNVPPPGNNITGSANINALGYIVLGVLAGLLVNMFGGMLSSDYAGLWNGLVTLFLWVWPLDTVPVALSALAGLLPLVMLNGSNNERQDGQNYNSYLLDEDQRRIWEGLFSRFKMQIPATHEEFNRAKTALQRRQNEIDSLETLQAMLAIKAIKVRWDRIPLLVQKEIVKKLFEKVRYSESGKPLAGQREMKSVRDIVKSDYDEKHGILGRDLTLSGFYKYYQALNKTWFETAHFILMELWLAEKIKSPEKFETMEDLSNFTSQVVKERLALRNDFLVRLPEDLQRGLIEELAGTVGVPVVKLTRTDYEKKPLPGINGLTLAPLYHHYENERRLKMKRKDIDTPSYISEKLFGYEVLAEAYVTLPWELQGIIAKKGHKKLYWDRVEDHIKRQYAREVWINAERAVPFLELSYGDFRRTPIPGFGNRDVYPMLQGYYRKHKGKEESVTGRMFRDMGFVLDINAYLNKVDSVLEGLSILESRGKELPLDRHFKYVIGHPDEFSLEDILSTVYQTLDFVKKAARDTRKASDKEYLIKFASGLRSLLALIDSADLFSDRFLQFTVELLVSVEPDKRKLVKFLASPPGWLVMNVLNGASVRYKDKPGVQSPERFISNVDFKRSVNDIFSGDEVLRLMMRYPKRYKNKMPMFFDLLLRERLNYKILFSESVYSPEKILRVVSSSLADINKIFKSGRITKAAEAEYIAIESALIAFVALFYQEFFRPEDFKSMINQLPVEKKTKFQHLTFFGEILSKVKKNKRPASTSHNTIITGLAALALGLAGIYLPQLNTLISQWSLLATFVQNLPWAGLVLIVSGIIGHKNNAELAGTNISIRGPTSLASLVRFSLAAFRDTTPIATYTNLSTWQQNVKRSRETGSWNELIHLITHEPFHSIFKNKWTHPLVYTGQVVLVAAFIGILSSAAGLLMAFMLAQVIWTMTEKEGYESFVAAGPKEFRGARRKGEEYFNEGRFKDAINKFEYALQGLRPEQQHQRTFTAYLSLFRHMFRKSKETRSVTFWTPDRVQEFTQALEMAEDKLSEEKRLLGSDRVDERRGKLYAVLRFCIGALAHDIRGEHEATEMARFVRENFAKTLPILEELSPFFHGLPLQFLANFCIGAACNDLSEHAEALGYLEKAEAELASASHEPDLSWDLNFDLGFTYGSLGSIAESPEARMEHYKKAIEYFNKVVGHGKPDNERYLRMYNATHSVLARTLRGLGDLADTPESKQEYVQQAIGHYEELGMSGQANDPGYLMDFGLALVTVGDSEKAIGVLVKVPADNARLKEFYLELLKRLQEQPQIAPSIIEGVILSRTEPEVMETFNQAINEEDGKSYTDFLFLVLIELMSSPNNMVSRRAKDILRTDKFRPMVGDTLVRQEAIEELLGKYPKLGRDELAESMAKTARALVDNGDWNETKLDLALRLNRRQILIELLRDAGINKVALMKIAVMVIDESGTARFTWNQLVQIVDVVKKWKLDMIENKAAMDKLSNSIEEGAFQQLIEEGKSLEDSILEVVISKTGGQEAKRSGGETQEAKHSRPLGDDKNTTHKKKPGKPSGRGEIKFYGGGPEFNWKEIKSFTTRTLNTVRLFSAAMWLVMSGQLQATGTSLPDVWADIRYHTNAIWSDKIFGPTYSFEYAHKISEGVTKTRQGIIRQAAFNDIDIIMEMERAGWEDKLPPSRRDVVKRFLLSNGGIWVAEGVRGAGEKEIIGAITSLSFKDANLPSITTYKSTLDYADRNGERSNCISVVVDKTKANFEEIAQELARTVGKHAANIEHKPPIAYSRPIGLKKHLENTRDSNLFEHLLVSSPPRQPYPNNPYKEYTSAGRGIDAYVNFVRENGFVPFEMYLWLTGRKAADPVLRMHIDNGAIYLRAIPSSRPEDINSGGYNMVMLYGSKLRNIYEDFVEKYEQAKVTGSANDLFFTFKAWGKMLADEYGLMFEWPDENLSQNQIKDRIKNNLLKFYDSLNWDNESTYDIWRHFLGEQNLSLLPSLTKEAQVIDTNVPKEQTKFYGGELDWETIKIFVSGFQNLLDFTFATLKLAAISVIWYGAWVLFANVSNTPHASVGRKIFAALHGKIIKGTRTGGEYTVKVFQESLEKGIWRVELWARLKFWQSELAGHMTFQYEPEWPSLTALDAEIKPTYRNEGLYSNVFSNVVESLPAFTRVRFALREEKTLTVMYDALKSESPGKIIDEEGRSLSSAELIERWREQKLGQNEIVHRLQESIWKALKEPEDSKETAVSKWSSAISSLMLIFPATLSGHVLEHARVSQHDMRLVAATDGNPWVEALWAKDVYLHEQVSLSPYLRQQMESWINTYFSDLGVPPPREAVSAITRNLSSEAIDFQTLYLIIKELKTEVFSKHAELWTDSIFFMSWLHQRFSRSFMEDVISGRRLPHLEGFSALIDAFRKQSFKGSNITFTPPQIYWAGRLFEANNISEQQMLSWLSEVKKLQEQAKKKVGRQWKFDLGLWKNIYETVFLSYKVKAREEALSAAHEALLSYIDQLIDTNKANFNRDRSMGTRLLGLFTVNAKSYLHVVLANIETRPELFTSGESSLRAVGALDAMQRTLPGLNKLSVEEHDSLFRVLTMTSPRIPAEPETPGSVSNLHEPQDNGTPNNNISWLGAIFAAGVVWFGLGLGLGIWGLGLVEQPALAYHGLFVQALESARLWGTVFFIVIAAVAGTFALFPRPGPEDTVPTDHLNLQLIPFLHNSIADVETSFLRAPSQKRILHANPNFLKFMSLLPMWGQEFIVTLLGYQRHEMKHIRGSDNEFLPYLAQAAPVLLAGAVNGILSWSGVPLFSNLIISGFTLTGISYLWKRLGNGNAEFEQMSHWHNYAEKLREFINGALTSLKEKLLEIDEPNSDLRQARDKLLETAENYLNDGHYVASLQYFKMLGPYLPREKPRLKQWLLHKAGLKGHIQKIQSGLDRLARETLMLSPEFKMAETRSKAVRDAIRDRAVIPEISEDRVTPLENGDVHVFKNDLRLLKEYAALPHHSQPDKKRFPRMVKSIEDKAANQIVPAVSDDENTISEEKLKERAKNIKFAAAIGVGGQSRRGEIFANFMRYIPGVGKIRLLDYHLAKFAKAAEGFKSLKAILIESPFTKAKVDIALNELRADKSKIEIERINSALTEVYNQNGTVWRPGSASGLAVPSHGDALIQLGLIIDDLINEGYEYYGFYNMNVVNAVPSPEVVAYLDYLRKVVYKDSEDAPWVLFAMTIPAGETGGTAARVSYPGNNDSQGQDILQILDPFMIDKKAAEKFKSEPENFPLFNTNSGIVHLRTLRQKLFGDVPDQHLTKQYIASHPEVIEHELIPALNKSVASFGDPDPRNILRTDMESKPNPDKKRKRIIQTATVFSNIIPRDLKAVLLAVTRGRHGFYWQFKTRVEVNHWEHSVEYFMGSERNQENQLVFKQGEEGEKPLNRDDVVSWLLEDEIIERVSRNGRRDWMLWTPPYGWTKIPHDDPHMALQILYSLPMAPSAIVPSDRTYSNVIAGEKAGVVIIGTPAQKPYNQSKHRFDLLHLAGSLTQLLFTVTLATAIILVTAAPLDTEVITNGLPYLMAGIFLKTRKYGLLEDKLTGRARITRVKGEEEKAVSGLKRLAGLLLNNSNVQSSGNLDNSEGPPQPNYGRFASQSEFLKAMPDNVTVSRFNRSEFLDTTDLNAAANELGFFLGLAADSLGGNIPRPLMDLFEAQGVTVWERPKQLTTEFKSALEAYAEGFVIATKYKNYNSRKVDYGEFDVAAFDVSGLLKSGPETKRAERVLKELVASIKKNDSMIEEPVRMVFVTNKVNLTDREIRDRLTFLLEEHINNGELSREAVEKAMLSFVIRSNGKLLDINRIWTQIALKLGKGYKLRFYTEASERLAPTWEKDVIVEIELLLPDGRNMLMSREMWQEIKSVAVRLSQA